MRKNLLLITLFVTGLMSCKDQSNSSEKGEGGLTDSSSGPAFTVLANEDAKAMIRHYRTANVRIKKPPPGPPGGTPPMGPEKSTLWADFNVNLQSAQGKIIKITAFTSAYYEDDTQGNKTKHTPTIILQIVTRIPDAQGFTDVTSYIKPATEDLCPDPPDCDYTIINPSVSK